VPGQCNALTYSKNQAICLQTALSDVFGNTTYDLFNTEQSHHIKSTANVVTVQ